MANEHDARPVAKLVLLQQACCDPRCQASHCGVLAVILDACYDKRSSYIGPTQIGRIAQRNPRTVRECLRDLEAWGYLSTSPRTKRSTWYSPNFPHAERTGSLVEWGEGGQPMRVHRPAMRAPSKALDAGPQTRPCGSTGPLMRVHRPEEAVEGNHSKKAVGSLPSDEEQKRSAEKQAEHEAHEKSLTDFARGLYAKAKSAGDFKTIEMIETHHAHRVADLMTEKPVESPEAKAFIADVLEGKRP